MPSSSRATTRRLRASRATRPARETRDVSARSTRARDVPESPPADVANPRAAAARDWRARAAAACAAAAVSFYVAPDPASAGGYGTGLGYFEALERERAISEEAVTLSDRGGRRANAPPPDLTATRSRGIPLSLDASDDGTDDSKVVYSDPSRFLSDSEEDKKVDYRRWGRAAFQWGVIFAVVANVRAARNRGSKVTQRLGLTGKAGTALVGTRWKLTLDIGRERGTWMPPEWGASGRRILVPVAVELREGGRVEPLGVGAFLPMTFFAGAWRLEGDALKFDLKMSGMTRGDIELPEDSLHFRTAAWGATMASRGNLLLRQTRFGFRREWRTVGVFKTEPLRDGDDLSGDDGDDLYEENRKKVELGAMRVSERRTT